MHQRSRMLWTLTLVVVLPLAACAIDADLDSDGDGLTDQVERELGTNPDEPDSDGDGYSDSDEHLSGTDPLDDDDRIYRGGWPFNSHKDEMGEPDWDTDAEEGAQLPRFQAVDQYGDIVDVYDFAGHGRPMVLDMGTIWCAPCKGMAAYLSTGDPSHVEEYPWWSPEYEGLYDLVQDEEIYWMTVLFSESETSGPADQEDCEGWHEEYPNDKIPVLADTDLMLHEWIGVTSYPVLNLVDDEMVIEIYDDGGPWSVLREVPNLP